MQGRVLYLIIISFLVIGMSLMNFKDLSFNENASSYILITTSLIMVLFVYIMKKYSIMFRRKFVILNIILGIALLYFILEVIFNISSSITIVRILKIIPFFCCIMFVRTAKRDIKKQHSDESCWYRGEKCIYDLELNRYERSALPKVALWLLCSYRMLH